MHHNSPRDDNIIFTALTANLDKGPLMNSLHVGRLPAAWAVQAAHLSCLSHAAVALGFFVIFVTISTVTAA